MYVYSVCRLIILFKGFRGISRHPLEELVVNVFMYVYSARSVNTNKLPAI